MDLLLKITGSGKRLVSFSNLAALAISQWAQANGYDVSDAVVFGWLNGFWGFIGTVHAIIKAKRGDA